MKWIALAILHAALVLGGVYFMLTAFGDELDKELDTQVERVERDFERDLDRVRDDVREELRREFDRRIPAVPAP